MYPPPTGPLPVTGVNMLAIALAGSGLIIAGLLLLRLAYFQRKRRSH
jgi:CHASE1-domain containing sensor protein